jgi:hypothetical protein
MQEGWAERVSARERNSSRYIVMPDQAVSQLYNIPAVLQLQNQHTMPLALRYAHGPHNYNTLRVVLINEPPHCAIHSVQRNASMLK